MKKLSMNKLRMLIEQEIKHDLAHDHASEIEPVEAFAGGENLVQPLDHVDVIGDYEEEDLPKAPEMLSLIDDEGIVITVSEARLRKLVKKLLKDSN
jgi:hypothetical protein